MIIITIFPCGSDKSCQISDKQYLHPPLKVKSHVSTRIHKLPLVISGTCEANIFGDNGKICAAEKRGWKYFGRGKHGTHDDKIYQFNTYFTQCLDICTNKRRRDGKDWNGMHWRISDGNCVCHKNDKGHKPSDRFLHFKVDD